MIALFGGVFDPIHNAHLSMAEQLNQQFQFEQFHFIPCKQQVLKQDAQASAEQRIAMLQLALEKKNYVINRIEIDRDTPSYAYDTLTQIRLQFPDQSLCFISGIDSFLTLPNWYRWNELFALCHFIIIPRNNLHITDEPLKSLLSTHQTDSVHALSQSRAGLIYFAKMPSIDLSSTLIREKIAKKISIEDCVPKKVWQYIKIHHLYGS